MELRQLGPYELGETLGKGGMGSVYAATDTLTGQRVAVKALTPHLAQAEGFRERFEAEIESLKTLRHEGIVRLFGYGEEHGTLFYSMELVEGTSLEEELQHGRRLHWRDVISIAIQLCRALKHAHDHGVIHRDLKPANVLMTSPDQVKLADFGIARLFGNTQLTTAGGVLGTADYMSPEQADGRPITDRCDQYSLGGVMYALLAGRPPFRAKSLPQMLQLQRYADPEPVRRYAPDVPVELERVVMQLLSKNPDDRFPNTMVLARHLEAMQRALSRPTEDDFSLGSHTQTGMGEEEIGETLLATMSPSSEAASPADATLSPDELAQANEQSVVSNRRTAEIVAAEAVARAVPTGGEAAGEVGGESRPTPARFTTVDQSRLDRDQRQPSYFVLAFQLFGLAAILGMFVAAGVYLMRPASADALLATIESRVKTDDFDSLKAVEGEMAEFRKRFPEDERGTRVGELQHELALGKLERSFDLMVRRGVSAEQDLLPIEQWYLRAMQLAESQPAQAVKMLNSIITLYGRNITDTSAEETAKRQSDCLELARRQHGRLRQQLNLQARAQLEELQRQFELAEQLERTEPTRARAVYRAIVDLYGDLPWAAGIVNQANERLAK